MASVMSVCEWRSMGCCNSSSIHGVLQFLFDSVEQFYYHVLLALREVQGLALVVFEERVVVDAAGELRAVEQIWVEQQSA